MSMSAIPPEILVDAMTSVRTLMAVTSVPVGRGSTL